MSRIPLHPDPAPDSGTSRTKNSEAPRIAVFAAPRRPSRSRSSMFNLLRPRGCLVQQLPQGLLPQADLAAGDQPVDSHLRAGRVSESGTAGRFAQVGTCGASWPRSRHQASHDSTATRRAFQVLTAEPASRSDPKPSPQVAIVDAADSRALFMARVQTGPVADAPSASCQDPRGLSARSDADVHQPINLPRNTT